MVRKYPLVEYRSMKLPVEPTHAATRVRLEGEVLTAPTCTPGDARNPSR